MDSVKQKQDKKWPDCFIDMPSIRPYKPSWGCSEGISKERELPKAALGAEKM